MIKERFAKFIEFIEKFQEGKFFAPIIAVLAFIFIALFGLSNIYKKVDHNFYDFYFELKPSVKEWEKLVFVDIDDSSTDSLGQFPWPRYIYGRGFETYEKVGVDLAVFDIMFPNNSPLQVIPEKFQSVRGYAQHEQVTPAQITSIVRDNDREFAESMKKIDRAVLSYSMSPESPVLDVVELQKTERFKNAEKRFSERCAMEIPEEDLPKYASLIDPSAQSISYPIVEFMETAYSFGFVNRDTDSDGGVRRVRLVQLFDGKIYFNLALTMLLHICRVDKNSIEIIPGKHIILKNAINPAKDTLSDIKIPIDKKGMMLVNWAGPGPREKSFSILPFFSLIEYGKFQDYTYEFLDELSEGLYTFQTGRLRDGIKELSEEYYNQDSVQKRKEIREQIAAFSKQKSDFVKPMLEGLNEEKDLMQEEFLDDPSPALEGWLRKIMENIRLTEIVQKTEELHGAIALTGLTATGTVDIGKVPLSHEFAMVGVYHNVANTILQGEFIKEIDIKINMLLMLILTLTMAILVQRFNAKVATISTIAGVVVVNIIVLCMFVFLNYWGDPFGYVLSVFIPASIITSLKHMNEEHKRKFIKSAFSRYLAPSIIDQIIKNPDSMKLGGEQREVTIFFSDVAKFSTISEHLTPSELVHLLNEYLSAMTEIILSYGGTVDKYGGDSIMAFFGAPLPMSDHAVKACLACLDQRKKLQELRDLWRSEGRDELFARMGMNTGPAIVGNMGSAHKMDYTVMGDSVNLAARLEGVNKVYGTEIMISEFTYLEAKEHIVGRKLDVVRVVGKALPVPVYEVICRKEELTEKEENFLKHYYDALSLYEDKKWKDGKAAFESVLKLKPEDVTSALYAKRCDEFIVNPPADNWDGVYSMTSK